MTEGASRSPGHGWGECPSATQIFNGVGSMFSTWNRRMLARVVIVTVAGIGTALLGTQVAQAAPTCQTSSPAGGGYTLSVCLADPASGATLSGKTTVTATV